MYSVTHRFIVTAVIRHSTVNTHSHITRPNTSVTYCSEFSPRVTQLTSFPYSVQLDTQLLSPSPRPMTSLAGVFELQSILGKTKCSKPISTPPCAGHTRSQSQYTKVSDVSNTVGSGGNPLPVPLIPFSYSTIPLDLATSGTSLSTSKGGGG